MFSNAAYKEHFLKLEMHRNSKKTWCGSSMGYINNNSFNSDFSKNIAALYLKVWLVPLFCWYIALGLSDGMSSLKVGVYIKYVKICQKYVKTNFKY